MNYQEYLRSPHWEKKKKEALSYYRYQCCTCGSKNFLNVHHKRYNNLNKEPIDDLSVLCASCHQKYHDIYKEMEIADLDDISVLSPPEIKSEEPTHFYILEDAEVQECIRRSDLLLTSCRLFREKNYV